MRVKLTSKRSGMVAWLRSDGTPTSHESEAGDLTERCADEQIAEMTEQLTRVVGRCAWSFEKVATNNGNKERDSVQ